MSTKFWTRTDRQIVIVRLKENYNKQSKTGEKECFMEQENRLFHDDVYPHSAAEIVELLNSMDGKFLFIHSII